jgi:hypothetical protein
MKMGVRSPVAGKAQRILTGTSDNGARVTLICPEESEGDYAWRLLK